MKNIKIGPKLMCSYLAITVVAACVCIYLLNVAYEMTDDIKQINEQGVIPLYELGRTLQELQLMRIAAYRIERSRTKEERDKALNFCDSIVSEMFNAFKEEGARALTEGGKKMMSDANDATGKFQSRIHIWKERLDRGGTESIPAELVEYASEVSRNVNTFNDTKMRLVEDMEKKFEAEFLTAKIFGISLLIGMAIFSIGCGVFLTMSITSPLNKVIACLSKGAEGDMRARVGVDQKDEIGIVANEVDDFFKKIQNILKGLNQESDTMSGASEELSSVSRQLASGAEETVSQSTTVASTTEQMAVNINAMASGAEQASANANEVASAAEEMSTNMNTIASAIEEMSASISQIAGNTAEVRKVAADATTKSNEATTVMSKLGAAAKEIGHVTDVIKRIADKTNLLALNATIEAASAGEAGKGFAVVAGEIKELANQSATSADDIAHRIEGIQNGTNDAVTVINDVAEIIEKINSSVEAIAGHVDQQTKASNEIASNVAQANTGAKRVAGAIGEVAKGANDVSRNAGEAAKGATHVSHNVVGMAQAAKESAQGASQVNQSAKDLSKIASDLKETVNQFKV